MHRWEEALKVALDQLDSLHAAGALSSPSREQLALASEALGFAFHAAIQQRIGAPLVESPTLMRSLLDRPFVNDVLRPLRSSGIPAAPSTGPDSVNLADAPPTPITTGPDSLSLADAPPTPVPTPTPAPASTAGSPGSGAPSVHRLLVLVDGRDAFIKAAVERWRANPAVEVRFQQLSGHDWNVQETLRLRMTGSPTPIPDFLANDLAWADTVLVEWGAAAAARISGMDFPGRLLVRIHRFEAFTVMPQLLKLERVDRLIFEVDSVRTAWERATGAAAAGVPVSVVPLECQLQDCVLPKEGDWRHTLALVGCASTVKDPAWALELLAILRERDERWRLLLVGDVLTSKLVNSPEEAAYAAGVSAALEQAGSHVELLGFRSDIPQVLQRVGVLLSTSLVEGTHATVLEGAASGALPVVRDWPQVAGIGGARANFPAEWVVSTPQEAAERILAWGAELDLAARDYVLSRWDASVAGALLDEVVLAGATPAGSGHGSPGRSATANPATDSTGHPNTANPATTTPVSTVEQGDDAPPAAPTPKE